MSIATNSGDAIGWSQTDWQSQLILALRYEVNDIGDAAMHWLLPLVRAASHPDALRACLREKQAPGRIRRGIMAALDALALDRVDETFEAGRRIIEAVTQQDCAIIIRDDARYPLHLGRLQTTDMPTVLFAKGHMTIDSQTVACIGTRGPSEFGRHAAERITRMLAEHGWTIVSGLAKGIDTIAHRAALAAGARTVAILGNGLDHVYPAENAGLAEDIIANGGLLLSEQPPRQRANARTLVMRDRIQSGMSVATIVFESSIDGGSMRTAAFAKEQGRQRVCLEPPTAYAHLPSCSGNHSLLSDGAYSIAHRNDYPRLRERLAHWHALLDGRTSFDAATTTPEVPATVPPGI